MVVRTCSQSSPLADNHMLSVVSSGLSGGCHRCSRGRCHGCRRRACGRRRGSSRRRRRRLSRCCRKQDVPEGEGGPGVARVHADALQRQQDNQSPTKSSWILTHDWRSDSPTSSLSDSLLERLLTSPLSESLLLEHFCQSQNEINK